MRLELHRKRVVSRCIKC